MSEQNPEQIYLTTSEAAKELEVPEYTLRYWETLSLLIPMKTANGHRRYRRGDIRKGVLIKDLFSQGYTAKGIKSVLSKRKKKSIKSDSFEHYRSTQRSAMLQDLKKEVQDIIRLLNKI